MAEAVIEAMAEIETMVKAVVEAVVEATMTSKRSPKKRFPNGQKNEDPVEQAMRENPGSWISWDRVKRKVFGIVLTWAEVRKHVPDPDDPNVEIDVAPGIHPLVAARRFELLNDESPNIIEDVEKLHGNADQWLDSPNRWFHGRTPRELLGTEEEIYVRYVLRAIRNGVTA